VRSMTKKKITKGALDLLKHGVGLTGLEPVTSSLSGKRSNRLSYRPVKQPDQAAGGRRRRLPHLEQRLQNEHISQR
jgi:hypothetical protein